MATKAMKTKRSPLAGRKIALGVTGSIAAYKACELVRLYVKAGAEVAVVMTRGAQQFVAPLTFRTLSRRSVTTDLFENPATWVPGHVSLADWCDALVVAPCTANVAANESVGSFALDALEASGTATLDVTAEGAVSTTCPPPAINTLNHDLWILKSNAFWTETGLAASTNRESASGGAITKYAYPATGSWNLAFDWSPGTPVPANIADWYNVAIGSISDMPTGWICCY